MNAAAVVAAAFSRDADIVVVDAGMRRDDLLREIRSSRCELTIIMVGQEISPLDRATLLASLSPLAIELAPHRRIGALDVTTDAQDADILEVARFLARADSTTGQVISVSGRDQPGPFPRSHGPSDSSTKR